MAEADHVMMEAETRLMLPEATGARGCPPQPELEGRREGRGILPKRLRRELSPAHT